MAKLKFASHEFKKKIRKIFNVILVLCGPATSFCRTKKYQLLTDLNITFTGMLFDVRDDVMYFYINQRI